MDILTCIKTNISACSYKELETVSLATDVPLGTLMKIKSGETKNPRIKTVQNLLNYFERAKSTRTKRKAKAA